MAKAARIVGGVVAGAAVWAGLWILGNKVGQASFPHLLAANQPVTAVSALLGMIAYSVILSVLAGFLTVRVAGAQAQPALWTLALLQLAFGIFAEVSYWSLAPVWYHLVFLALIVPATVFGGKLRSERALSAAPARA
jgi:hypothetical protein